MSVPLSPSGIDVPPVNVSVRLSKCGCVSRLGSNSTVNEHCAPLTSDAPQVVPPASWPGKPPGKRNTASPKLPPPMASAVAPPTLVAHTVRRTGTAATPKSRPVCGSKPQVWQVESCSSGSSVAAPLSPLSTAVVAAPSLQLTCRRSDCRPAVVDDGV